jgi:vitamin K-dependent gamma-carboxylase
VTTTKARRALERPVPIAWLAAFRVLFGLTMAVSMGRFLAYGWVDDFFVRPRFHFKYWGFGWLPELSASGIHGLFWALAGLALAIAAGAFFRLAAALFVLGFAYVQLIDVATYLNHYYLALLLAGLLAVSPAHRAFSVDALRVRHSVSAVPALWLYLFRFQVGVVYTFAGIAKAHGDWLVHAQPLRIWLGSKTSLPLLGPLFTVSWAPLALSWAGFLFDSTIVWFLLVRRLRPFAFAAVIAFHALTRLLFPIGMFPVIMVLSALVFFPPDWPLRLARGRFGRGATGACSPLPSRAARVAIAAYCVLQVLVPLRFLAYGGNVRWHEQGMRFSWRVMVREKNGSTTFVLHDPRTGRTWHVQPRAYLTPLQEREMATQPDLILALAHRIRDDAEARGEGPVEVRVQAIASLNGRRAVPLVDPDVDLATVEDGLARAPWIMPAPSEAPPHLRPL